MRYRAQRDENGVVLKVNCPDCRLTAWQNAESPALHGDDAPEHDDVGPYMESIRDGLAERLREAGCPHPMDSDAAERLTVEVMRLFDDPSPPPAVPSDPR